MKYFRPVLSILFVSVFIVACGSGNNDTQQKKEVTSDSVTEKGPVVPAFDPDSAYLYVSKQVVLGPRTPGSDAQKKCAAWMYAMLKKVCDTVYKQDVTVFSWGIALIGFVVMSQLSFLGEYLPRAFPMHLRGTGGSFATNVGGRMIGTSAAFITTKLVTLFPGSPFDQMARAAGWVGFIIVIISVILGFFLPEPKADDAV